MSKLSRIEELFRGRHFDREVIILCVRWYLRYKLSFRDLAEMMAEPRQSTRFSAVFPDGAASWESGPR